MARKLPVWLEPRITDMSHEPFVVARARMGGFAVARVRSRAEKRSIGRRAGLAGSFSRWGWGQMGLVTRPAVSYLGFVALEVFLKAPEGLVRVELIERSFGLLRKGGIYAVTEPLEARGYIATRDGGRFGKRYFITEKGRAVLYKTRSIIKAEAVNGC